MSSMLTRRQLLRAAAALAAALVAPGRAAAQAVDPLLELLVEIRIDPEHLAAYAETYLAAHPEERQPEALIAEFARIDRSAPGGDFKETLRERIRKDFREERTVTVDGWILSRTEVRLWTLVHLLSE